MAEPRGGGGAGPRGDAARPGGVPDGPVEAMYAEVRRALPPGPVEPPHLAEVGPGIRVLALRTLTLPPAATTNVYLVGPPGGPVLVVDPGSPFPDQQGALDAVLAEVPISGVLLTHHHGDHVGGAAALAGRWGVPVIAHPATADRLAGVVEVTTLVEDEAEVAAGDVRVRCVHTPGHAAGHLCFEVDGGGQGRWTLAGDLVAGVGTILVDPDEGDMGQYLASLERLLARPAAALCPAHGPVIADGPARLREYLAHRRLRERRVWEALAAEPRAIAELVPRAYADTPPALWPLAARSLEAHLVKLVREGRAHRDGARYSARPWP